MYLRISLEDADNKNESNSIGSQRLLILDYICHDEELAAYGIDEFCDDGYSGTSMDRPGIQKLLKEIKENKIQCIIVKDMSRFSRDYIELGSYINQIFPFMGVRFIAINDHYDSRGHKECTMAIDIQFRTLLYDLYSKDISVKVKASLENKCLRGEYIFGQVPFGYEKSKTEKHTVIVNEKEAKIVRYVFSLALAGNGAAQIARMLNKEHIPTRTQMRRPEQNEKSGKVQAWNKGAIRDILNNRFYLGEMVYGKTRSKYVGGKNSITVPREKWKVVPDHHEPLITPEIYQKVCSFGNRPSNRRKRTKNPLVGKIVCGGCGYAMIYKPPQEKNRSRYFQCYQHSILQIPECCVYISADLLEKIVLTMLNHELVLRRDVTKQKEGFAEVQGSCIKKLEKMLAEYQRQKKQLQAEADILYERYAMRKLYYKGLGEVQEGEYRYKADNLNDQKILLSTKEEQTKNKLALIQKEGGISEKNNKPTICYSPLKILTQDVTDAFIKKIYVYKGRKIEIEWNFCEFYLNST